MLPEMVESISLAENNNSNGSQHISQEPSLLLFIYVDNIESAAAVHNNKKRQTICVIEDNGGQ